MAASAWRSHLDRLSAGPGAPPSGGSPFEIEASDGTVLRGEDFGSKQAPPIVLIHGWSGSAAYWRLNIVELVGKGLRVIVYDHRGHGDRCCLFQPLHCCVCVCHAHLLTHITAFAATSRRMEIMSHGLLQTCAMFSVH